MRVGYEHILHKVLFLGLVGGHSLAASFLRVIFVYRQSLDVSEVRHAHHDVLFFYQVAYVDVRIIQTYFRPARVGVFFLDFGHFRLDYVCYLCGACDNGFKLFNQLFQLVQLVVQTCDFQTCKTGKTHIEDCARLLFSQIKFVYELFLRVVAVVGLFDDFHHAVDIVLRYDKTFDDVVSFLRLFEVELGAADNYLLLMRDVTGKYFFQPHDFGLSVGKRQQSYAV